LRRLPHRPRFEELEDRTVPAAVLTVNPADPTAFHTIGAAITAAHPGDTIMVDQATYNEDVLINKSLSLVGVPNATTKAKPIITGTGGAGGTENVVAIASNITGVLVQNFIITSPAGVNAVQDGIAIGTGDNDITVTSNIIRAVRNAAHPITGSSQTAGIVVGTKTQDIQITHNTITDILYGTTGVDISKQFAYGILLSSSSATDGPNGVFIQHNLISKVGDIGINIINGSQNVVVNFETVALISGLHLGIGISIGGTTGSPSNILIANSTIKGVAGSQAVGISVGGSATGVQLLSVTVTGVTTGSGFAIGGSANAIVSGDSFTGNAFGVLIHTGYTGNLTLHYNSIAGNTSDGLVNVSAQKINAEANWWGSATGPKNAGNPGGTGDKIVGSVDFANWLTLPAGSAAAVRPPAQALSASAISDFFRMADTDMVW
jgi:hypothetical protein